MCVRARVATSSAQGVIITSPASMVGHMSLLYCTVFVCECVCARVRVCECVYKQGCLSVAQC